MKLCSALNSAELANKLDIVVVAAAIGTRAPTFPNETTDDDGGEKKDQMQPGRRVQKFPWRFHEEVFWE